MLASQLEVTGKLTGRKLATELKKVSISAEVHIMTDVIELQKEISRIDTEITWLEDRVNQTIYRLHGLTEDEIAMIEAVTQ